MVKKDLKSTKPINFLMDFIFLIKIDHFQCFNWNFKSFFLSFNWLFDLLIDFLIKIAQKLVDFNQILTLSIYQNLIAALKLESLLNCRPNLLESDFELSTIRLGMPNSPRRSISNQHVTHLKNCNTGVIFTYYKTLLS